MAVTVVALAAPTPACRYASPSMRRPQGLCEARAFASVPGVDIRSLAREERADLAAFLARLSPQQWQASTLCAQCEM